jgi:hypothetical protein
MLLFTLRESQDEISADSDLEAESKDAADSVIVFIENEEAMTRHV